MTAKEVLELFPWSNPKEIETKRGRRLLRTCVVSPEVEATYQLLTKDKRNALSALGVVRGTVWKSQPPIPELAWWQEVPKEILEAREKAVALSSALDADIEIPAPKNVVFRGYQKAGIKAMASRFGLLDQPKTGNGILLADEQGIGKEQPVTMPVLTPNGWRNIGDLRPGDVIMASDGGQQYVTGVFPQGIKQSFLVEFSDGASVECGIEHLWAVRNLNGTSRKRPFVVLPLSEIQRRMHESWEVPLVQPLEFHRTNLPIPPYLLGVLIGDGCLTNDGINFVPGDSLVPEEVAKVIPDCFEVIRGADYGTSTRYSVRMRPKKRFHPYTQVLNEWGLKVSGEKKFIPPEYLFASIHDRRELLRGLMDTDGTANGCRLRYYTVSQRLAKDVQALVWSLGGHCSINKFTPTRPNELPLYNLCMSGIGNPFTNRKVDESQHRERRRITKISPLGMVDQVCIAVSSPDRLYVTKDYLLTHNTAQAIGLINLAPKWQDILIIAPKNVKLNWLKEIQTFSTRNLSVAIAEGKVWPTTNIVITNRQALANQEAKLSSRIWDCVIVDEAHFFSNPKTKWTVLTFGGRVKPEDDLTSGIPCRFRMALTGTPMKNRPINLWPIIHWLDPITWGQFWQYKTKYCQDNPDLEDLQRRLRSGLMIRREKRDVLSELPPKVRQLIPIPATSTAAKNALAKEKALTKGKMQMLLDRAKKADYTATVKGLLDGLELSFDQISAMRQETALAKLPEAIQFITDMLEEEDKVLVWAHHQSVVQSLMKELSAFNPVKIVGGMLPRDAQTSITRFANDPSCRVCVGSILAAGSGIDGLQNQCSTAVFVELDWVPGNMDQAEDRLHRMGQMDSVTVYHLVLEGTLDAHMAGIIVRKQEMIQRAMNLKRKQEAPIELPETKTPTKTVFGARSGIEW